MRLVLSLISFFIVYLLADISITLETTIATTQALSAQIDFIRELATHRYRTRPSEFTFRGFSSSSFCPPWQNVAVYQQFSNAM